MTQAYTLLAISAKLKHIYAISLKQILPTYPVGRHLLTFPVSHLHNLLQAHFSVLEQSLQSLNTSLYLHSLHQSQATFWYALASDLGKVPTGQDLSLECIYLTLATQYSNVATNSFYVWNNCYSLQFTISPFFIVWLLFGPHLLLFFISSIFAESQKDV